MTEKRKRNKKANSPIQKPVSGTPTPVGGLETYQIGNLFLGLSLGPAQHHENLTIFPLVWSQPHEPPYILLGNGSKDFRQLADA